MSLTYPFGVIDYESSGLDAQTYPIEIGIALRRTAGGPLEAWSSLIRPSPDWRRDGHWNDNAEKIHGITREQIAQAPYLYGVGREAMQFAQDIPLYYDGGSYDEYWHQRFVSEMPKLTLNMRPIHEIVEPKAYLKRISDLPIVHRAEADAVQILNIIEAMVAES